MTTLGPRYPLILASSAVAPYSNNDWVTVTSASLDDGVYANVVASQYDANDWTFLLRAYNFGFTIPVGASIGGITVEIEGYGANGANSPQHVMLTKNSSASIGTELGSTASWTGTPTNRTFGGASSAWGTTWTYDEINASNFGVLFANKATANDADVFIDYIRVTVDYSGGVMPIYNKNQARKALLGVGF